MSHSANHIDLHVTAGRDLVFHEGTENNKPFATVFALHNHYAGKDREERTMPISVLFSGRTLALAKKTICKGASFVAGGILDFVAGKKEGDAGFYQIRCDQLTPIHQPKTKETE